MNEEIDESEFYHQDFTTASDWEIFIARIEEIVNQWKNEGYASGTIDRGPWLVKNEKLAFIDTNFDIFAYRKVDRPDIKKDLDSPRHVIDSWHDFSLEDETTRTRDLCLSHRYGLDEFIVLRTSDNVDITSESKIKILLSSLYIASGNTRCNIPMFVQIREAWQHLYLGVYELDNIRTDFEMVHLKRGPQNCYYLAGLLELFKSKVRSPCTLENVVVSAQSTYDLVDFGAALWKQETGLDNMDVEDFYVLPFGVAIEPITGIVFKATWRHLSEYSVVDTESYTDFNPVNAPDWSCSAKFTKDPLCLLGDNLNELLHIVNSKTSIYDLLGDFIAMPVTAAHNPLDRLTQPVIPSVATFLSRAARNSVSETRKSAAPIPKAVLEPLLYFLFPDADERSDYPYGSAKEEEPLAENEIRNNVAEKFKGYKTCAEDSLVWRLATVLSHCLQSLGGVKAFCYLWYEFVQEMRYRWDKSLSIPGLSSGVPDLRTCLLNQKLQMLNCCLERKMAREVLSYASAENSGDSEDEFFDCFDRVDEAKKREKKYAPWNQPVGRLTKFGDLKLIKTGDRLYIPVTQDPVLKTEDQMEEDTDILLQLGSDQEASELRAKILSASLLSDMESFKAANPGAILEDFIRWYSPRDWIEVDEQDEFGQKKGHLSKRMMLEDNIWVEMWNNARPVPANRQKRLFDDTKEAEKVLQYLDFRNVGQLVELLVPVITHAAVRRVITEAQNLGVAQTVVDGRCDQLLKLGERITRDHKFQVKKFEGFIQEVTSLELTISQINSLQQKLNSEVNKDEAVSEAVGNLAMGREVEIKNKESSLMGSRLVSMFRNAKKETQAIFPSPTAREFVLRTSCVRPSVYSAKCPQMLRAFLGKNEFRLTGAFSGDTAFF
ncbi:rab3 GTPase-activating protein catalytic subunit [Cylas formicarius]|uniref:rab3 GTPase-activating protein catalytic subunit n=1 Tax=Cylas formicarius TaxID=197179 RepID=UPI002958521F|nr:rab3 GTPase-activating protein catalytic subunit [Cylas formicarius]XP_060518581.1 rab3 GTPase-activating protein catalytic subunit [Cylas formicarius]